MEAGISGSGLSFETFLDTLAGLNITSCNPHFRQQWHPLERSVRPARVINADRESLVDALLECATPDQEARPLLDAEIARIASYHHAQRTAHGGDLSQKPFSIPWLSAEWPGYESFLTPSTRRKIERLYAADFAAYSAFL